MEILNKVLAFLVAVIIYNTCEWLFKYLRAKYPPKRIQYRYLIHDIAYVRMDNLPKDQVMLWHEQTAIDREFWSDEEVKYTLTVNAVYCIQLSKWERFLEKNNLGPMKIIGTI